MPDDRDDPPAEAVEAVAAFLRALPQGAEIPRDVPRGWAWETWIGRDLAAAVERAAKEAGDG